MAKNKKVMDDGTLLDDTTFHLLVDRNIAAVRAQFAKDPSEILVSIQLQEDQIDHLNRGLTGRSRRLIPLSVLAELVAELAKQQNK